MKKILIIQEISEREKAANLILTKKLRKNNYIVKVISVFDYLFTLKVLLFKPDFIIENGLYTDSAFLNIYIYRNYYITRV